MPMVPELPRSGRAERPAACASPSLISNIHYNGLQTIPGIIGSWESSTVIDLYDADHEAFRPSVRGFVNDHVAPNLARWEQQRHIDRAAWEAAGKQGLLGLAIPERYGGTGVDDYRLRCVIMEEFARVGAASLQSGVSVHEDIVLPYLLDLADEEQKQRWLPGMAAGTTISAIAMTEPDAGSDLRGIRTTAELDGDHWVVNGSKTFITNGIQSDLIVVVVRTDSDAGSPAFSLIVVERGAPGFERGRKLDKIGLHAQDTAELVFSDARVPAPNLLGERGHGLRYLMQRLPKERLSIAVAAQFAARAALEWAIDYCKKRKVFGATLSQLQNTRFELAELAAMLDANDAFISQSVRRLNAGRLTSADAARAKLWSTELQLQVTTRCLQLFGGYGYMMEYPIARAFIDSRVQTIYGGTSEIMKELIARDLLD
jgi:alkylation response protein AidB-like acyl-CoA dehydrogenase